MGTLALSASFRIHLFQSVAMGFFAPLCTQYGELPPHYSHFNSVSYGIFNGNMATLSHYRISDKTSIFIFKYIFNAVILRGYFKHKLVEKKLCGDF